MEPELDCACRRRLIMLPAGIRPVFIARRWSARVSAFAYNGQRAHHTSSADHHPASRRKRGAANCRQAYELQYVSEMTNLKLLALLLLSLYALHSIANESPPLTQKQRDIQVVDVLRDSHRMNLHADGTSILAREISPEADSSIKSRRRLGVEWVALRRHALPSTGRFHAPPTTMPRQGPPAIGARATNRCQRAARAA